MEKVLVVFSGGQDSTTCLYWAIDEYGREAVETVSFDYGQRHGIELESAQHIAGMAGVPWKLVSLQDFGALSASALTGDYSDDMNKPHPLKPNLPASFVPGRNILFLTAAAAVAFSRGISILITGVSEEDYSGYPDCREDTMTSLQRTLSLGMDTDFTILTPLIHMSKSTEVELAKSLEGCMEALAFSHTCYNGEYPPCGNCPACQLRSRAFSEAGVVDPLVHRAGITR